MTWFRSRWPWVLAVFFLVTVMIGWGIYQEIVRELPEGLIQAAGRIEGDEVRVSSEIPARVESVLIDQGETVAVGELLVELDRSKLKNNRAVARARVNQSEAELEQALKKIKVIDSQTAAVLRAAEAALEQTRASKERVESRLDYIRQEYNRHENLLERGKISRREYEKIRSEYRSIQADYRSAGEVVRRAEADLDARRAELDETKLAVRRYEASGARLESARAELRQAEDDLDDARIKAPLTGRVLSRFVEPGELVGVGTPLVEIVDLDQLYMKVYVPGPRVGKLSHGDRAKVYTDAYPEEPFWGRIRRISDRAEFTPRTVETREERPRLVFAVEISIDNPAGRLKPGMPGDAILRWDPDVDWQQPR